MGVKPLPRHDTCVVAPLQEGNGLNIGIFGPVDLADALGLLSRSAHTHANALQGGGDGGAEAGEEERRVSEGVRGVWEVMKARCALSEALSELMVEDSLRRSVAEVMPLVPGLSCSLLLSCTLSPHHTPAQASTYSATYLGVCVRVSSLESASRYLSLYLSLYPRLDMPMYLSLLAAPPPAP